MKEPDLLDVIALIAMYVVMHKHPELGPQRTAEEAYDYAEAMMKERHWREADEAH